MNWMDVALVVGVLVFYASLLWFANHCGKEHEGGKRS
jgi:hypothetical protein